MHLTSNFLIPFWTSVLKFWNPWKTSFQMRPIKSTIVTFLLAKTLALSKQISMDSRGKIILALLLKGERKSANDNVKRWRLQEGTVWHRSSVIRGRKSWVGRNRGEGTEKGVDAEFVPGKDCRTQGRLQESRIAM